VHRPAPVCRQAVELVPHAQKVLFLLRRKVFPGFHPAEYLMLSIRRKAVEALQALLVFALCFPRQSPKGGIALKCFSLLFWRLLALLIEPLARVVPLRWWLVLRIEVLRRLGSRLKLRGRSRRVAARVRTGSVGLRTRFTALFPVRLAIVLPLLLGIRAGNIWLLVAPILRRRQLCH